jgi:hypothetical protein
VVGGILSVLISMNGSQQEHSAATVNDSPLYGRTLMWPFSNHASDVSPGYESDVCLTL